MEHRSWWAVRHMHNTRPGASSYRLSQSCLALRFSNVQLGFWVYHAPVPRSYTSMQCVMQMGERTINNRVLVYMNNKVLISECSWYTPDLTDIRKVVAPTGQRGWGRRARHVPASPTAGAPPCRRKPLLPCAAGSRCSSAALIRQGILAAPARGGLSVWRIAAGRTARRRRSNLAWWTRLNEQYPNKDEHL